MYKPLVRAVAVLAVLAVVSGCVASGARDTTAPSAPPGVSVTPDLDCVNEFTTVDKPVRTLAQYAVAAQAAVIGTFNGRGQARWNTADRKRPAKVRSGRGAAIYTSILIHVDTTIRGEAAAATRAVQFGGQIGCDRYGSDYGPDLADGQRYLFLLMAIEDSTQKIPPAWDLLVMEAWPVADDGTIVTPYGPMPLPDLQAIFVANPYTPPAS